MQLEAEDLRLKTEYVERFGVKRFQGSDANINFYTGLPAYIDLSNLFLVSFVYAEQMYVCIVNDRINLQTIAYSCKRHPVTVSIDIM